MIWQFAAGFGLAASGVVVPVTAMARNADAAQGATLYAANCGSCHSLDANRVGPAHRGVYGRKAGSAPGYDYTAAVRNSRVVWSAATLDRWLQNPRAVIPGTKMAFTLRDAQKRADIIAFMRQQSQGSGTAR